MFVLLGLSEQRGGGLILGRVVRRFFVSGVAGALGAFDEAPLTVRDRAKSDVADYEAKKGEAPPAHMSMKEVEDAARNALLTLNALSQPKKSGGLFGLLSNHTSTSNAQD